MNRKKETEANGLVVLPPFHFAPSFPCHGLICSNHFLLAIREAVVKKKSMAQYGPDDLLQGNKKFLYFGMCVFLGQGMSYCIETFFLC